MAKQDNSIIPIISHTVSGLQEQCVNARDLHSFLQVGRDFSNWMKDRIAEYGFVENNNFILIRQNGRTNGRGGDRRSVDYFLTLEMAKELAMVEKNEKGKEARRYFIECERRLKHQPYPEFLMIHKSVLQDTGKALVWMGDYGLTSQPYYGGAQQPYVDGRPALLSDNSKRYYLSEYVGNVLQSQHLATEERVSKHLIKNFPHLGVINRMTLHDQLMRLGTDLVSLGTSFTTKSEINARFDNFLANNGGAA